MRSDIISDIISLLGLVSLRAIDSRSWNSWVYVYGVGSSGSLGGRVGARLAQDMCRVKPTVNLRATAILFSFLFSCGWEPCLCLSQAKKHMDLGLRYNNKLVSTEVLRFSLFLFCKAQR